MKSVAYLFQAILILAWWIGLASSETFFQAFQFDGIGPTAFWSFFIPDLVIIAGLSFLRIFLDRPWIERVVLGAFAYASLYCLNASLLSGSGLLPTSMMFLGLAFNVFVAHSEWFFRESTSRSFGTNFSKTLVQLVLIWTATLAVIPSTLIGAFGIGEFLPPLPPWMAS